MSNPPRRPRAPDRPNRPDADAATRTDIDDEAEEADDHDGGVDGFVLRHRKRIEQDIADALFARDHLARHHGDECEHQSGADADDDLRQRRGKYDAQQTRTRVHAHRGGRPEHLLFHRARALIAVIDHRQGNAEKDHQRLRGIADAEPQHDDRHQGGLRHRIDDHQQRIEERCDEARASHHQPNGNCERQRERKADQHAADRGEDVEERFLVAEDRGEFTQRGMRGWQAGDVEGICGDFPQREQASGGDEGRETGDGGETSHTLASAGSSISRSISTTYC
jgi:hypothetical protein